MANVIQRLLDRWPRAAARSSPPLARYSGMILRDAEMPNPSCCRAAAPRSDTDIDAVGWSRPSSAPAGSGGNRRGGADNPDDENRPPAAAAQRRPAGAAGGASRKPSIAGARLALAGEVVMIGYPSRPKAEILTPRRAARVRCINESLSSSVGGFWRRCPGQAHRDPSDRRVSLLPGRRPGRWSQFRLMNPYDRSPPTSQLERGAFLPVPGGKPSSSKEKARFTPGGVLYQLSVHRQRPVRRRPFDKQADVFCLRCGNVDDDIRLPVRASRHGW